MKLLDDWIEYLVAARRKIDIADFHAQSLGRLAGSCRAGELPSVEQQAHFEGVLYAFVASTDQVAEAIVLARDENLLNANLQQALEEMPKSPLRTRLFEWWQAPIAADLRDIRRRATHHHYRKTPSGPLLEVQKPQSARPYDGSRALEEYALAATEHLRRFAPLIDELQNSLKH